MQHYAHKTLQGHSRCRGDADGRRHPPTVRTFTGRTGVGVNGGGTPNSENLKLVERFTLVSQNTVEWKVRVENPDTWTKPWTFALDLTKDPGQGVFEYACHEGNYAMKNILSGTRSGEKR